MAIEVLSATSKFIEVANHASLENSNTITVMGWFKVPTSAKFERLIEKYVTSGGSTAFVGYGMLLDSSGHLFGIMGNGGLATRCISSSVGVYDDNTWHHFCAVFKSSSTGDGSLRLYVDGAEVSYGGYGTAPSAIGPSGTPLWIGRELNNGSYYYSDFTVEDPRVYTRALSAAEISTIYAMRGADKFTTNLACKPRLYGEADGTTAIGTGLFKDLSGTGNSGTPNNSPVFRAAPLRLFSPRTL